MNKHGMLKNKKILTLLLTKESAEHVEDLNTSLELFIFLIRYSFLLTNTPAENIFSKRQFSTHGELFSQNPNGARYLDPKYSRWLSTDPALSSYIEKNYEGPSGGIYNSVNLNLYHYGGNNPIKYVDPDGNEVATASGAVILGTIIIIGGTIYYMTTDEYQNSCKDLADAIQYGFDYAYEKIKSLFSSDYSKSDDTKDKKTGILQNSLFGGGPITSASPSPMFDPDDKSSRNKPKQNGEPNSTEVEYNYDRSVKRITQYDEKGNFMKEIRPNSKGQHGIDGPTTKEPFYNTRPDGRTFRNGYIIRAATPEEIKLLGSF